MGIRNKNKLCLSKFASSYSQSQRLSKDGAGDGVNSHPSKELDEPSCPLSSSPFL